MSYSLTLSQQQRQAQTLKQTQRLIMSPQMQQAIYLLQMPILELTAAIEQELEQNPLLEGGEPDATGDMEWESLTDATEEIPENEEAPTEQELDFSDGDFEILRRLDEDFREHFSQTQDFPRSRSADEDELQSFLESSIQGKSSLYEFLLGQISESVEEEALRKGAEILVGYLDDRGFLTTSLQEISLLESVELSLLEESLHEVQRLEPRGIGARDLRESLLIQLRALGKGRTLAYAIVEHHFEDLLHNRVPAMKRQLGCSADAIREAIEKHIAKLDLQPGTNFDRATVQYITPDVTVRWEGEELVAEVNGDNLPPLCLNRRYLRMLEDPELPQETKEYLHKKLLSGKWLLRNLHQRNETILRITQSLLKRQREFFLDPLGQLHPLTMKVVAEELQMHESTVARAVSGKYVDTPRGLLPLRGFFTNSCVTKEGEEVSSHDVKQELKALIDQENKRKPLSDQALSEMMKAKGIDCARRTVAKYRVEMKIGNTSQRRSYA